MSKFNIDPLEKAFEEINQELKDPIFLYPIPENIKTEEELDNWITLMSPNHHLQWWQILRFPNLSDQFKEKHKENLDWINGIIGD